MMHAPRLRGTALATLAACLLTLTSPAADAQCFGDDNLDNGFCCGQTQANLPFFDDVGMEGLGVCWTDCTLSNTNEIIVEWQALQQTVCGQYVSPLRVIEMATGAPLMEGLMTLDYSRTWLEFDPSGQQHQVWRFTVKADMRAIPGAISNACPVPPILSTAANNGIAFFYGYMDYANCQPTPGTQPSRNALVLYHACDKFIHTPGFSSQPGVFNPFSGFAIVAPHNPVQPFTPMNQFAPGGPIIEGATRNVAFQPFICNVEDRISQGSIDPLAAGCLCPLSQQPKQQTLRDLRGQTSCPSPVGIPGNFDSQSFGFPNTLPWFELVTTSIGCWGNPDVYPGEECAWVDEGLFIQEDVCLGPFIEVKYGGTTNKGWDAVSFNGSILGSFTDLVDNFSAPLFGPYALPLYGQTQPSDRVLFINTP